MNTSHWSYAILWKVFVKLYHFSEPSFTICDADELDGGITKDEIHAPECLGFLFSLAGVETDDVDSIFDMMDVDSNGSVTEKEFLNKALTMI